MGNTDRHGHRSVLAFAAAGVVGVALALGQRRFREWAHREDPAKFDGRVRELVGLAQTISGDVDLVLLGSSTIEFWETSERDLQPIRSRNLGMSGSKVGDQQAHLIRLAALHRAPKILVYIGSNDINGKLFETKLGTDLAARVIAYLHSLKDLAPDAHIYYVSILQSPVRARVNSEIRLANRLIQVAIESMSNSSFIDADRVLIAAAATGLETLFRPDRLHLSASGYVFFSSAIRDGVLDKPAQEIDH